MTENVSGCQNFQFQRMFWSFELVRISKSAKNWNCHFRLVLLKGCRLLPWCWSHTWLFREQRAWRLVEIKTKIKCSFWLFVPISLIIQFGEEKLLFSRKKFWQQMRQKENIPSINFDEESVKIKNPFFFAMWNHHFSSTRLKNDKKFWRFCFTARDKLNLTLKEKPTPKSWRN